MSALESARHQLDILLGSLRRLSNKGRQVAASEWQPAVESWLRNNFSPAIEPWLDLPEFQEGVLWSRRTFAPDSTDPLRGELTQLSNLLQGIARLIGEQDSLWAMTQAQNPSRIQERRRHLQEVVTRFSEQREARENLGTTGETSALLVRDPPEVSRLLTDASEFLRQSNPVNPYRPLQAVNLGSVTGPLWEDLANPSDFLWPQSSWNLIPESLPPATMATLQSTFVPSHETDLLPENDLFVRSFLCRARAWWELLSETTWDPSFRPDRFGADIPNVAREAGMQRTRSLLTHMETECLSSAAAQQRESCVVIFKVVLAMRSGPAINWVQFPRNELTFFSIRMNNALNASLPTSLRVLSRLGLALEHLSGLSEIRTLNADQIAERITAGGLVLKASAHEVFWEGKPIDLGQSSKSWDLLYLLTKRAKETQSPVTDRDLHGMKDNRSVLSTRVNRLKTMLPSTLSKKITSIRGEKAYRLKLDQEQIDIF